MNKFKSILTKDIGWKLFSVAVAICMWFIVLNVENPVESKSFTSYIEIQNENAILDQNKTILNIDEIKEMKVSIKIRGKRMTLDRLAQGKDVSAYIDLSSLGENYSGQEATVPVKIKLPSTTGESVSIEYVNPSSVTLRTDSLVSKEMAVSVVKEGAEQEGYEAGDFTVEPSTLTVYGPSAEVEKVAAIKATVDVSTLVEDNEIESVPAAYDTEGKVVESVFLSSSSVKVSVDMKKVKRVPVEASISGVTADGFVVKGVKAVPDNVFITGEEDILQRIDSVVIDSVNVYGRTETFTTDIYIANYLPGGVHIKSGSSEKVQLTVDIEPQSEKILTFSSDDVEITGYDADRYDLSVDRQELKLTVFGSSESIGAFDGSDVKYVADLSGLGGGEHKIGISCELPDGIEIYGDRTTITVTLTEKQGFSENESDE